MNSFKINPNEMMEHPMQFPETFGFSSYVTAFKNEVNGTTILGMFFNTVTLAVGQTAVSMALTCMAAYTLAKYRFKLNGVIYMIILVCSVVPTFGAEASMYHLMTETGLKNQYIGMLLMCGGFGAAFLYLHSFFKEIPWSFAESAMLDGASDLRIFLQIMIPLAKNGIMVFTVMKFMGYWNEYWIPFLYYQKHPTLSVGLTLLSKDPDVKMNKSVFYAGTILCVIPAIILYATLSDKLMGNLNAGGIKG
jgi:ABC-type glycerol-3-phosphate transport system permease component